MSMKNESVYDKLKKEGYTDEDIAESFIFPRERTEEEEKQWAAELNAHRKKYWNSLSEEERIKLRKELNELAEKFRKEDEESV